MTDLYDLSPLLRLMLLGSVIALGPLAWVWWRSRGAGQGRRLQALTVLTLFLTFDLVMFGSFAVMKDVAPGSAMCTVHPKKAPSYYIDFLPSTQLYPIRLARLSCLHLPSEKTTLPISRTRWSFSLHASYIDVVTLSPDAFGQTLQIRQSFDGQLLA